MSHVSEVSRDELLRRREDILTRFGVAYDQLRARAEASLLVADEWAAWEELRDIAFLLAGDDAPVA